MSFSIQRVCCKEIIASVRSISVVLQHEDASIAMFKFLISENKICESLGKANIRIIEDIIGFNGSVSSYIYHYFQHQ